MKEATSAPGATARKSTQLQIRVTPAQKASIKRAAEAAGQDVSSWILARLLPSGQQRFLALTVQLASSADPRFVLAEISDLLAGCSAAGFQPLVASPPSAPLDDYWSNYLAAMVEVSAQRLGLEPPGWTSQVRPLPAPVFGSDLHSLRLHLLTRSLPAFRRRNLFVDASVGDRV